MVGEEVLFSVFFKKFNVYLLETDRDRAQVGVGRERERERENLKQAPGSELSALSWMQGLNSQSMRS